jgi:hypothetical protein
MGAGQGHTSDTRAHAARHALAESINVTWIYRSFALGVCEHLYDLRCDHPITFAVCRGTELHEPAFITQYESQPQFSAWSSGLSKQDEVGGATRRKFELRIHVVASLLHFDVPQFFRGLGIRPT